MKTVYLFLATGFEEIEALTIVDMLRRAEIDITTVSISRNLQVEGAHGILLQPIVHGWNYRPKMQTG